MQFQHFHSSRTPCQPFILLLRLEGKFPSIANKTCKNKDRNENFKIENNWLSDKGYTEIIVTRGEKELKPYYKNFKESLAAETIQLFITSYHFFTSYMFITSCCLSLFHFIFTSLSLSHNFITHSLTSSLHLSYSYCLSYFPFYLIGNTQFFSKSRFM